MEAALPFTRLQLYPLPPPRFTLFFFTHFASLSLPLTSFAARQCRCFVVVRVECRVCAGENRLPVLRERHIQGEFTRIYGAPRSVRNASCKDVPEFFNRFASKSQGSHLASRTLLRSLLSPLKPTNYRGKIVAIRFVPFFVYIFRESLVPSP